MDEDAVEAGGTAEEEAVFFSESEFADALRSDGDYDDAQVWVRQ